jgi:hypothetical protein
VKRTGIIAAAALLAGTCSLRAQTTVDPEHPFAYAGNAGWLLASGDTAHGAAIGLSFCSGYLWSATCGWIGLGSGPTNGWRYTQSSASDWGVNHDGEGRLTGFAYGANIGWVTFEQTYGKPRIDLRSGVMSGAAWSANIGWIGFSNALAHVRVASLSTGADSDGDAIPDAWEYRRAGNLTALRGNGADADGDGVADLQEYAADTDPQSAASALKIVALQRLGASDQVDWTVEPTRFYRLRKTSALGAGVAWSDSGAGLLSPGAAATLARQVSAAGATARFYRVQAVLPLSE